MCVDLPHDHSYPSEHLYVEVPEEDGFGDGHVELFEHAGGADDEGFLVAAAAVHRVEVAVRWDGKFYRETAARRVKEQRDAGRAADRVKHLLVEIDLAPPVDRNAESRPDARRERPSLDDLPSRVMHLRSPSFAPSPRQ